MKNRILLIPGFILILLLLFIQCNEKKSLEDVEELQETQKEESVINLSDDEIEEFDIRLGQAQSGKLQVYINAPGEIVIPPDNLAHIHPRFPGMVKEVKKHIGDRVREGEVLAIIESNESLAEYQIKSLINGTIIEKHITRGEIVEADNDLHRFVVANLSTVWAYLNIYQKDLPFVKKGQKVTISFGAGFEEISSRINYVSPVIDETTRTATARVVIANPKGIWKPGLFVNGAIITNEFTARVAIPPSAIETIESKPCVFVKSEKGFEPRFITIGRRNQNLAEVLNGLNEGDNYVTKGGFTLKAEMQKEMFGDDHGH